MKYTNEFIFLWSYLCRNVLNHNFVLIWYRAFQILFSFWVSVTNLCFSKNLSISSMQIYWHNVFHYSPLLPFMFVRFIVMFLLPFLISVICIFLPFFFIHVCKACQFYWLFSKNQLLFSFVFLLFSCFLFL